MRLYVGGVKNGYRVFCGLCVVLMIIYKFFLSNMGLNCF